MTAFQRTIISFGIVIGLFGFFIPWRTPDMTIVYPDNCVFVIDPFFSRAMQLEIKDFIDTAYKKSKSPSNLLPKIESHFPAIKSVVIDMQNPELLNFSIQTYQPIFLLNDEHVICQTGKMFSKATFAQEQLLKLENISFQGAPTPKSVDRLMIFFESLTDPILKDFSVRWIDKHAIWLDQKQGQNLSLLVGYNVVPNKHDIMQCRNLRGQIVDKPCKDKRGKPCKNNMTWVCDLRFDQQIVLFSTNKGV
jgi:hypothetical protein